MKRYVVLMCLAAALLAVGLPAQEREDRTLLSHTEMRAIINEASGERQLHLVLEMVPYPRLRERAEYQTQFRETEVVAKHAREYGFSNVEVVSYPSPGRSWHATRGELWIVEPAMDKLYDINDVLVSLASGSETGDVTAELIDVGVGTRPEDYAGRNVAGKIVLGSASAGSIQRLAVFEHGAVGVISYNGLRADDIPDQLMSQSVSGTAPSGKAPGFGWSVAPRIGRMLAARLAQGETLKLRSIVQSETFDGELEMVHATIPGDGSSTQAVMVSAHLYEGYIKQGANDDNSGCALTLEMGRAYLRLVAEGKLPRPKRTIHFLWVPEISGTRAWLQANPDVTKHLIANLNFDMEGLRMSLSGSAWVLHRTPDSLPSFLNDLCASVLEYVADTNRERLRFRGTGYGFTLPVVARTGSREPLWAIVDKHYGASDHVVFIGMGIPAVMFITWPDHFYHSSEDTPERLDPTQFKRAAVVGVGSMALLASADDARAAAIAGEVLGRGLGRLGDALGKGTGYLADATDAAALQQAYKDAIVTVRHQTAIEKATLASAATLFANPDEATRVLGTGFGPLLDQRAVAIEKEVAAYYGVQTGVRRLPAGEPPVTELERQAARTVVEPVATAAAGGPAGGGRGGGGAAMANIAPADREAIAAAQRKIPSHMTSELRAILPRKLTVLDIRNFLTGEFEPVPLADVFDYVRALEKLGQVKLIEQPPAPARKR